MIRRRFLQTVTGSLLALSGCATWSEANTTPTTDPTGATEPTPTATDVSPTTADATSSEPPSTDECSTTEAVDDARSGDPEANDALVIESSAPVSGTNVNVGARGIAKNNSGHWLVDCVLDITGVVGGQTFTVRATRSPLAPQSTWEWKVPFGREADALSDDSPTQITIDTRAEFMDWD